MKFNKLILRDWTNNQINPTVKVFCILDIICTSIIMLYLSQVINKWLYNGKMSKHITLYVFSSAWFVWRCCESERNSVSVWGKLPSRWVYQFQFNAVKPSLTNYIYIIYKIGDWIMNIHWNTWKFHISRALLETITTITRFFPTIFSVMMQVKLQ